ncbi:MAG: ugd [Ignavibacteria bacterium]|nr:ugd [Ignavibacteria bacterium]
MSYNIAVIGTGYVGLVTGTCFAATGNNVICVDIDTDKISKLNNGICPIFEPGLDYLIKQNVNEERLHFTTDLEKSVIPSNLIFLCLPTPPNEDGSADLSHVLEVSEKIAGIYKTNNLTDNKIIVNKSTVPVGTAEKVLSIFKKILPDAPIEVASNPEFLREGFAVDDSMKPERVVIGTTSKYVEEVMRELYLPFVRSGNPIHVMDIKSAEVTKYASNSFLATKISFMNDLSGYCSAVGADIESVRIGMGSDSRIGKRFLFAGIGFGGSCFPKDVRALIYSGEEQGINLRIIKTAYETNKLQINSFMEKIFKRFNGNIQNLRFAIWGLAFKPNTDDIREAPAFTVIDRLLEKGASVAAYDPEAAANTRLHYSNKISYSKNMYDCLANASALIIVTEWNVFRTPDFKKLKSLMTQPLLFDGRNLYALDEMEKHGIEYHCVGRRTVLAK